jgi:hypothetical protein
MGFGFKLTNSLRKELCGYLLIKKIYLLVIMDFWSWKIWIGRQTRTSQNGKNYIDSHSNFVIKIQYMM